MSRVIPKTQKEHEDNSWSEQTSTNAYVDLGDAWDKLGFEKGTIVISNTGDTNDVYFKVYGSLDNVNYNILIKDETTLGEEVDELIDIGNLTEGAYIPYIKIQIKSVVADNHTTVTAYAVAI